MCVSPGEWDDTSKPYGDRRRLNLRFHLSDDTVEIFELFPKNSGRDVEVPKVIRRQLLPLLNPVSKDKTGTRSLLW